MKKIIRFSLLTLIVLAGCFGMAGMMKGGLLSADAGKVTASYAHGKVTLAYGAYSAVEFGEGTIEVWDDAAKVATLVQEKPGESWNALLYSLSTPLKEGSYKVRIPSGAVKGNTDGETRYAPLTAAVADFVVTALSDKEFNFLVNPQFSLHSGPGISVQYLFPDSTCTYSRSFKETTAMLYENDQKVASAVATLLSDSLGGYGAHFDYVQQPGKDYKVVFPAGSWYIYAKNNAGELNILEESKEQVYAWKADMPTYDFDEFEYAYYPDELEEDVETSAPGRDIDSYLASIYASMGSTNPSSVTNSVYTSETSYESTVNSGKPTINDVDNMETAENAGFADDESDSWQVYDDDEIATDEDDGWQVYSDGSPDENEDTDIFAIDGINTSSIIVDETSGVSTGDIEEGLFYADSLSVVSLSSDAAESVSDQVVASLDGVYNSIGTRSENLFATGALGAEMLEGVVLEGMGVSMSTENYYNEKIDFDFPVRYNQLDEGEINWYKGTKLIFKAKEKMTGLSVKGNLVANASADKGQYVDGLWTGEINPGDSLVLTANDEIAIESLTVSYDGNDLAEVDQEESTQAGEELVMTITKKEWSTIGATTGESIGTVSSNLPNLDHYHFNITSEDDPDSFISFDVLRSKEGKIICTSPTQSGYDLHAGCRYTLHVSVYDSSLYDAQPVATRSYDFVGTGSQLVEDYDASFSVASVGVK